MMNSPIVTTAIAIVFIFFVFSMMASLIHEYITKLTKNRSKFLARALSQLLKDEFINQVDFGQIIYNHPLIAGLKETADTFPSYIPADVFATALIDSVADYGIEYLFLEQANPNTPTIPSFAPDPGKVPDPYNDFKSTIQNKLKDSGLKKTLSSFLVNTNNYNELKANIELWYNHYMDRISGWYKKDTAGKMIIIGWAIAIIFNVDIVNIFKTLRTNNALSYSIAASAENYVSTNSGVQLDTVTKQQVQQVLALSDSLEFPIGYKFSGHLDADGDMDFFPRCQQVMTGIKKQVKNDGGWLLLFMGWFISAIAISRGAPFWFDILSKFVNVRMSGAKPVRSKPQKE